MKNFTRIAGTQSRRLCAVALAAVIGFSFAACGDSGDPSSPASLSGSVHISTASGGAAVTDAYTDQTLYAVYSGSESGLTYQWKLDGENIASGTGASYAPAETGDYTVSVSAVDYSGSALSAKVSVSEGSFPGSVHISKTAGGEAVTASYTLQTLYAVYTGTAAGLTYQWKKDGVDISGASQMFYTPALLADGSYTVNVGASGYTGNAVSAAVVVGSPPLSGNVHISSTPDGAVIAAAYAGDTLYAVYSETKTGLTYQWKKDGENVIPDGTDETHAPDAAGEYSVTVSKAGYQSVTSEEATVIAEQYEISDVGPGGGFIFYVSEEGFTMTDTNETCHYLEAAPLSAVQKLEWGYSGTIIGLTGAEYLTIGSGRKNTNIMGMDSPAAKYCLEYSNNGKDDWFLPSRDELGKIWDKLLGGEYYYTNTPGVTTLYWLSYEENKNFSRNWYLRSDQASDGNSLKTKTNDVLPIRAF